MFDSPTNRAQMYGEEDCGTVISNSAILGEDAFCVWPDSFTLTIYLGCGSTIEVGDSINIIGGVIQSEDGTATIGALSLRIGSPVVLPEPQPIVSGPRSASTCVDLVIDATQTTGGGCRAMIDYSWFVTSDVIPDANLPAINSIVNPQKGGIVTVTSAQLQNIFDIGRTYTFHVLATNRFNQSATLSFPVFINLPNVPAVTITPSFLIVNSADEIKLHGIASVPSEGCSGFNSEGIIYTWVRKSGPPFAINTQTANSRALYITRGSLQAGNTYELELRASAANNKIFGSSTTTIVVRPSEIKAHIQGGDRLFTLGVRDLVLDASDSVDLDGNYDGLHFEWSCVDNIKERPCFADSDSSSFLLDAPIITIPSTLLTIGEYTFNVEVSKAGKSSDSTSVRIYTNGDGPEVTISYPLFVNPSEGVSLVGDVLSNVETVEGEENIEISYRWFVLSNNFDLTPFENCSIDYEGLAVQQCRNRETLTINPDVLASGAEYRFRLETSSIYGEGFAEISFVANEKPNGGCCTINSLSGNAFDGFQIKCLNWEAAGNAEDALTRYRWFRREANGNLVQLNVGISFQNSLSFILPPGDQEVITEIVSSNGAVSRKSFTVSTTLPASLAALTTEQLVAELIGNGNNLIENNLISAIANENVSLQVQLLQILTELMLPDSTKRRSFGNAVPIITTKRAVLATTPAEQREFIINAILNLEIEDTPDTTSLKTSLLTSATSVPSEISENTYLALLEELQRLGQNIQLNGLPQESLNVLFMRLSLKVLT